MNLEINRPNFGSLKEKSTQGVRRVGGIVKKMNADNVFQSMYTGMFEAMGGGQVENARVATGDEFDQKFPDPKDRRVMGLTIAIKTAEEERKKAVEGMNGESRGVICDVLRGFQENRVRQIERSIGEMRRKRDDLSQDYDEAARVKAVSGAIDFASRVFDVVNGNGQKKDVVTDHPSSIRKILRGYEE